MNVSFAFEPTRGLRPRIAMFLLRKLTNSHSKRILILTSLYCRLMKIEQLKEESIDKLNDLLRLAFRRDALRLPAAMQHLLWNDAAFDAKVQEYFKNLESATDENIVNLSESLYEAVPEDFKYSNKSNMLKDFCKLIKDVTSQKSFSLTHGCQYQAA